MIVSDSERTSTTSSVDRKREHQLPPAGSDASLQTQEVHFGDLGVIFRCVVHRYVEAIGISPRPYPLNHLSSVVESIEGRIAPAASPQLRAEADRVAQNIASAGTVDDDSVTRTVDFILGADDDSSF